MSLWEFYKDYRYIRKTHIHDLAHDLAMERLGISESKRKSDMAAPLREKADELLRRADSIEGLSPRARLRKTKSGSYDVKGHFDSRYWN